MKFIIKHEIRGRMRIHICQQTMSFRQADMLLYYLQAQDKVTRAKVYERTADAVIYYQGSRENVMERIKAFRYDRVEVPEEVLDNSGRELNTGYREKLIGKVVMRFMGKIFLPVPVRNVYTAWKSIGYIYQGIRCLMKGKIEVPVLDAAAIGVSVLRRDMATASSTMFLLGIGELLEEWTHKKSVDDLARSLALNVNKVWIKRDGQEVLCQAKEICPGDHIVVHMGNVIPFDGDVTEGEAMVNQSFLTGESVPVRKAADSYVYAGTVVEEGELTIKVQSVSGSTKFEKIVRMIEDSEKLKSGIEGKAEHLADRLVPYTLVGTGLVYILTRNVAKALSVLMVDFSCALKLAMPIAVLSAIREAATYGITVKGGKYLEAASEAETIVFDKTGTLTKAKPEVVDVISFDGRDTDELLRIAACLEEHFPHSMAKAVVDAARKRNLEHEEMHSKVNYVVAHGIATHIGESKAIIGSYHFVFEDEGCQIPEGMEDRFKDIPEEHSHLYLAIDDHLAAVICIEDPLREEAPEVIRCLKENGIEKVVMMTGDNERTARAIAKKVGVDQYYSEVLPEDKASFIEEEKKLGHKVVMIGDGINDSPALSAADAGVAISDGAEIAREIADITIAADDLHEIVTLKKLSNCLMRRIHANYRLIVGFNTVLILLGISGVIAPTTSALLHNTSTLAISLKSMQYELPRKERFDRK